MATVEQDPASGNWRIRIYFQKKQYFRSCDTTDEQTARTILGTVEETIRLVKRQRLAIPDDTEDIAEFLMNGGKVTEKSQKVERKTLKEVIDAYFAAIPSGAKEANSLLTEKIHLRHFQRLLKGTTPIRAIGVPALQKYVVERSNESGTRGRKIKSGTIRKELVTFGQLWRFAKANNWVSADYDRKAIKLPKTAEKPPFQTWEEIETKIEAGGLTEAEISDLWDCLFLRGKEILAFLAYAEEEWQGPLAIPRLGNRSLYGRVGQRSCDRSVRTSTSNGRWCCYARRNGSAERSRSELSISMTIFRQSCGSGSSRDIRAASTRSARRRTSR